MIPVAGSVSAFLANPTNMLFPVLDDWVNNASTEEIKRRTTVKDRILECYFHSQRILDLSNLDLASLPTDCWSQLSHLETLNLSQNRLIGIPREIEDLKRLGTLDLSRNSIADLSNIVKLNTLVVLNLKDNFLKGLPSEISNLTKLERLDLSSNQFGAFPKELCSLSELRRLHLGNNSFPLPPAQITQLTKLTHLELNNAGYSEIPPDIFKLRSLVHLDISGNRIKIVSYEIEKLVALQLLHLEHNPLTLPRWLYSSLNKRLGPGLFIPKHLEPVTGLDSWINELGPQSPEREHRETAKRRINHCALFSIPTLDLRNLSLTSLPRDCWPFLSHVTKLILDTNHLNCIPDTIDHLTILEELNLNKNCFTEIPHELFRLVSLQTLEMENNEVNRICPGIGDLRKLQSLSLSNNTLTPHSISLEITKLLFLEKLYLDSNYFDSFPEFITKLTRLKSLSLGDNQITVIPSVISRLTELTDLDLGNNQIEVIPPEIGMLTELTDLQLFCNTIAELPLEICNLTKLRRLFIFDNVLTQLPPRMDRLVHLELLHLNNNHLESISDEIGRLPHLRELNLQFNPIVFPDGLRELLESRLGAGFEFCLPTRHSVGVRAGTMNFSQYLDSLKLSLQRLQGQAGNLPNIPNPDELKKLNEWDSNGVFNQFLRKIEKSPDWSRNLALQLSIYSIVCDAAKNEVFRKEVMVSLENANSTCEDMAAVYLFEMEATRRIVCEQMNRNQAAAYLLGLAKIEIVNKLASTIASEKRLRDVVEISIGFQIHLKDPLRLPIQISSMCYQFPEECIPEVLRVKQAVINELDTSEKCAEKLSDVPLWIHFLENEKPKGAFSDLLTAAHNELEGPKAKTDNEEKGRQEKIMRTLGQNKVAEARRIALEIFQMQDQAPKRNEKRTGESDLEDDEPDPKRIRGGPSI